MRPEKDLDIDIYTFFEQIESQNRNDRMKTLRLLMDKYIHINKSDYLMDIHDLNTIVSNAKRIFVDKTMPMFLGEKKRLVHQSEQGHLCMIEATIGHLNKTQCLKKLPKFNYQENK